MNNKNVLVCDKANEFYIQENISNNTLYNEFKVILKNIHIRLISLIELPFCIDTIKKRMFSEGDSLYKDLSFCQINDEKIEYYLNIIFNLMPIYYEDDDLNSIYGEDNMIILKYILNNYNYFNLNKNIKYAITNVYLNHLFLIKTKSENLNIISNENVNNIIDNNYKNLINAYKNEKHYLSFNAIINYKENISKLKYLPKKTLDWFLSDYFNIFNNNDVELDNIFYYKNFCCLVNNNNTFVVIDWLINKLYDNNNNNNNFSLDTIKLDMCIKYILNNKISFKCIKNFIAINYNLSNNNFMDYLVLKEDTDVIYRKYCRNYVYYYLKVILN